MIPIIREVGETLTLFAQLETAVSFPFEFAENLYFCLIPFYFALLLFLQCTHLYLH